MKQVEREQLSDDEHTSEDEEDVPLGEQVDVDPSIWASHLESQVDMAKTMGVEAHTRLVDVEANEYAVELGSDIEKVEPGEGHHARVWIRNVGLVTVTGGAIAAAIAIIRHQRHKT